jgi:hypothetical protein
MDFGNAIESGVYTRFEIIKGRRVIGKRHIRVYDNRLHGARS